MTGNASPSQYPASSTIPVTAKRVLRQNWQLVLLGLVSLIIVIGVLALNVVVSSQASSYSVFELTVDMTTLTQRIPLLGLQLVEVPPLEREEMRAALREHADEFERNFHALVDTSATLLSDHPLATALHENTQLHERAHAFGEAAHALTNERDSALARDNPHLIYLMRSNGLLESQLSTLATLFELERSRRMTQFTQVKTLLLIAAVSSAALTLYIGVQPLRKRVAQETQRRLAETEGRKQAETELFVREERYRALVEALAEGILLIDRNARIVECNPAAARILGLPRDELLNRTTYDSKWKEIHEDGTPFAPEDQPAITALRTGKPQRSVIMGVYRPDGGLVWLSINAQPIFASGDEEETRKPIAVVSSFIDITEQITTQREAERASKNLRILMDSIPDCIFFKDRQSRFTLLNQAEAVALEIDNPADALGMTDFDFHQPDAARGFFEDEQRILSTGVPSIDRIEYNPTRDGQERWFSTTKVPLRNEQGEIIGLAGISRNITERIQAERERRRLELELERAKALSTLMRDTSHELRTPLSIINTSLYFLRRTSDAEQQAARLHAVEQQVQHLSRILDQLQMMSALEQASSLSIVPVDIAALLQRMARNNHQQATARKQHIEVEIAELLPLAQANERQLEFALQQILDNALLYTPENGVIILRAYPEGEAVIIEIEDNGIGIHPDDLPHIFNRFYKADKARSIEHRSGVGLGLSMVEKIIQLQHGTIHAQSELGKGSLFRVRLPADRGETVVETS